MSYKIELMTQPAKDNDTSVREDALRKLLELVESDLEVKAVESATTPGVELDEDGFEIPQDKIPLDGHFSTDEVKELVKLTQEEGMLLDDVNVKVVDSNEVVGDKIQIVEEEHKEEKGEDKKEEKKKEEESKSK